MQLVEETQQYIRHFTVTGYVVNSGKTKLLLIHHKKLNKWVSPGGHLEENEVPHEGAIREVLEETGIRASVVMNGDPDLGLKGAIDTQIPRPYALCYQLIPAGREPEHIHLDMMYVLEADDTVTITARIEEVHGVEWRTKDEILQADDVFDSVKGFAGAYMK